MWSNSWKGRNLSHHSLDNLRIDEGWRFWIVYPDADEDICDAGEGLGQVGMEVEIPFPMSHNA